MIKLKDYFYKTNEGEEYFYVRPENIEAIHKNTIDGILYTVLELNNGQQLLCHESVEQVYKTLTKTGNNGTGK